MTYEIKDTGERIEFSTGMIRDSEESKPRFDLLHPLGVPYSEQMLTRVAMHLSRGAQKYEERNWEKANTQAELDRTISSLTRHLEQYITGETDEDHAAAVITNVLFAETIRYKMSAEAFAKLPCMPAPDVRFARGGWIPPKEPRVWGRGEPEPIEAGLRVRDTDGDVWERTCEHAHPWTIVESADPHLIGRSYDWWDYMASNYGPLTEVL